MLVAIPPILKLSISIEIVHVASSKDKSMMGTSSNDFGSTIFAFCLALCRLTENISWIAQNSCWIENKIVERHGVWRGCGLRLQCLWKIPRYVRLRCKDFCRNSTCTQALIYDHKKNDLKHAWTHPVLYQFEPETSSKCSKLSVKMHNKSDRDTPAMTRPWRKCFDHGHDQTLGPQWATPRT
jgi:hypothetical protein